MTDARALTLTLVDPHGDLRARRRDDALAHEARDAVRDAGGELTRLRALSETAYEATVHGEATSLRAHASRRWAGARLDWAVQPGPARVRRLLVCDMDSTVISCECVDEIAEIVGIKPEIAAITERAMRGELDFEASLRARVARLKGVKQADLERVYAERVRLNPGARTLAATLAAASATTALVSGGFTFFTERVAADAGFARHQANALAFDGDALAGGLVGPVLGAEAKRAALEAYAKEGGFPPRDAIAIGDGANDLAILGAAGLGVAYRAKPVVADAADARIESGDLRSALYFQGLEAAAFVERG